MNEANEIVTEKKMRENRGELNRCRLGYDRYNWHNTNISVDATPEENAVREHTAEVYNKAVRALMDAAFGLHLTRQLDTDKTADLILNISMASYTDCIRYAGGLKSAVEELDREEPGNDG